jgi:hypothetical protein
MKLVTIIFTVLLLTLLTQHASAFDVWLEQSISPTHDYVVAKCNNNKKVVKVKKSFWTKASQEELNKLVEDFDEICKETSTIRK